MALLLAADSISLALVVGVLIVLLRRQPANDVAEMTRPVRLEFVISAGAFNLTALLATLTIQPVLMTLIVNLRYSALVWLILTTFSLIVTSSGQMRQALQVMARAGVVILLLLQFPLWEGYFFRDPVSSEKAFFLSGTYAIAGLINLFVLLFYIGMTAFLVWQSDTRSVQKVGRFAVLTLLAMQILALFRPESGFMNVAAIVGAAVGVILIVVAQPVSKLVSN